MHDLQQLLESKGYTVAPSFTGQISRSESQWFVGRTLVLGSGAGVQLARFGDWKTGEVHTWCSPGEYTAEQLTEIHALATAAEKEAEKERSELHATVAMDALLRWKNALTLGESPYFTEKKIQGLHNCRLEYDDEKRLCLLVPAFDAEGNLWGIQTIRPDSFKSFMPGMRIQGCFVNLSGQPGPDSEFFLAEGIATAASIKQALEKHAAYRNPVVLSCFNAGNLERVALAVQAAFSPKKIVICGDDDRHTKRPNGTPWNPGRDYARRAATAVGGIAIFPKFPDPSAKASDYNDLHVEAGLDEVAAQIERALKRPTSLEPIQAPVNAQGKKQKIPESVLAETLAAFYGDTLTQCEGNLFEYRSTHWHALSDREVDAVKIALQRLAGGDLTSHQVNSAYQHFLWLVDHAPVNLYQPNPNAANFLDGTLHMSREPGSGRYVKEFREHSPGDYLTHVIPLSYQKAQSARNPMLDTYLDRAFEGAEDKAERITAVQEMLGACLVPTFPRVFILHGPGGTGKSQLLLIASRLVHQENVSFVDPSEMAGFTLVEMAGKLVNIVTDIDTRAPIQDRVLKRIEDRAPIRMDRKFKRSILAPLPAVHLFAANALPPMGDGGSGAHTRRFTLIEMPNSITDAGKYTRDYGHLVFESSPEGVLAFALAGLDRLLAQGGLFTNPGSGKKELQDWQTENDVVADFLEECRSGEMDRSKRVLLRQELKLERKLLWECFVSWHLLTRGRAPWITKRRLFNTLTDRKFKVVTINGRHFFQGMGLEGTEESVC